MAEAERRRVTNKATPKEVASEAPPPGLPAGVPHHEWCKAQRQEERKREAEERFVETVQEGSSRCQEEFLKAELEAGGPERPKDALRTSIRVAAAVKAALAETREMMATSHRAQVAAADERRAKIERETIRQT